MYDSGKMLHRITCMIHSRNASTATEIISRCTDSSISIENGRNVRQRYRKNRFLFSGRSVSLEDSPVDIYRLTVDPAESDLIMQRLIHELKLSQPGRGTIFLQEVTEYIDQQKGDRPEIIPEERERKYLLNKLSLISCILSMHGSGEDLAGTALELGTGLPIITHGSGTGIRDKLGLLRITVPQEKDLVHLLVPAIDAEGISRLLIEVGRLNRPGKGFLYMTPVSCGLLDTRLKIGTQEQQASIEQIIAAIDELKNDTAWRRRFPDIDSEGRVSFTRNMNELCLNCPEERSSEYVSAALEAGAGGATVTRTQQLRTTEAPHGARERCIITLPERITDKAVSRILEISNQKPDTLLSLQLMPVPFSFSYRV
ncbi:hypothetical protein [Spirochaeta dissipatitropha]